MRPRKQFAEGSVELLQGLLKRSKKADERARIQAVLMRALCDSPPQAIASLTGLSVNSVHILHSRFLREGSSCLVGRPGRGGNRRSYLPAREQEAFLKRYEGEAAQGLVLSVAKIKSDYEALIGHAVSDMCIYRMMKRIGWRKVVPRPFHPKKQAGSEEAFKKSMRKSLKRRRHVAGGRP